MSAVRDAAGIGARLHGLPPVLSPRTRVLVLGSFPGAASLAAQQYYAHPRNQFWRILQAIWPSSPDGVWVDSYENRIDGMLSRGLGLWDVYAACEREGSLDTSIRNPRMNDFASLRLRCPQLRAIVHNGGESYRHARHVALALGAAPTALARVAVAFHRLPSTSPANASWRFERKLAAWREVFQQHGLA